jgi:hypothetical protein
MIRRQSAFDGPVIDYKARDIKAELVGSETLGDKPVHHIKMTMPDGTMQHLYLDAGTGLEAKVTMEAPGGVTTEQLLTDYRQVDGLMLPHSITVMTGGVVSAQMTITKVEFNPTLDDAMFRIPR